ncbi:MAG: DUF438 domain-containing protein [Chloroflexi bacterium]|nr:DUF438 domain-containing protein [Chloroflexota bacterium]BCY19214.1 hypothetical protein hrd7_30630 [Leptolinea sp. HRD-7]
MSEYINNRSKRIGMLKNILKGLHQGKPVEEVRAQFAELVQVADSGEIAEVEQMLIAEGMPVSEIQNLCDLHVSVVRDSLNQQIPPENQPGHPLHTFKAENEEAASLLDALQKVIADYAQDPTEARKFPITVVFEQLSDFPRHYLRKENLLFPILERYGFTGPSQVMWGIQDQIRAGLNKMKSLLKEDSSENPAVFAMQLKEAFETFAVPMREMFYKEEKILFPAALERLKEDEWYSILQQEPELGYFRVQPGTDWKPAEVRILEEEERFFSRQTNNEKGSDTLFDLETGALSIEQINLMLTNLPVDVTFVDENDEVRFFSQTRERIFERQATIIGRKVQLCHPPSSMDKVQKILDDFRTGKRDVAEFWIQMMGKFVHIRYFALRDRHGKYRGTIEVSQDVAPIRALEGERRLLND